MERNELLHSAFQTLQEVSEIRNHQKVVYQERPCMITIMYSPFAQLFRHPTANGFDKISSLEKSQALQTQLMQDLST